MKKNLTELVSLLDRSGSMQGPEGANIDAVETAGRLGIAPSRAVTYHCDSQGTRLNYEVVGQAVAAVRCSAPLDAHWKDAIEADFRKRQRKGRK